MAGGEERGARVVEESVELGTSDVVGGERLCEAMRHVDPTFCHESVAVAKHSYVGEDAAVPFYTTQLRAAARRLSDSSVRQSSIVAIGL